METATNHEETVVAAEVAEDLMILVARQILTEMTVAPISAV